MERFRLRCDIIFEAKDITDAFLQLTDHFGKRAMNQDSQLKMTEGEMQISKIVPNLMNKRIIDDVLNKEDMKK